MPIQKLSPNFEAAVGVEANNYQYNGIELVEDFGLHVNHAAFRTLDPQIGRWWQIDPLAELAFDWTPYRLGFDNPILYADPLGLFESRRDARQYRRKNNLEGKIVKGQENGNTIFSIEFQTQSMRVGEDGSLEVLNIKSSTWEEGGEVITAAHAGSEWQEFVKAKGAVDLDYTLEMLFIPLGRLFSGSKGIKTSVNFAEEGVEVAAKESSRVLLNTSRKLQAKFKHAADFGVVGNYSKANASKFSSAINQHINSAGVQTINGTYRGQSVIHYLNPNTGMNVIATPSGQFISGWKLNPVQLQNVLKHGGL